MKILVIEDDADIASNIGQYFEDKGHQLDFAFNGAHGLALATAERFDLIILDLMLPGLDGLEICKRLRRKSSYVPILMLTSKSSELDRVLGLEIGADDYVTKPFSIMELMARVKAIFRRIEKIQDKEQDETYDVIHAGDMIINTEKRSVTINGSMVEVTSKEFDLLLHFARNPERVFTRSQLLDKVWGYGHEGYEHTVNSHINRLRSKIEDNPAKPRFIITVWGVGYKFADLKKQVTDV